MKAIDNPFLDGYKLGREYALKWINPKDESINITEEGRE